MRFGWLAVGVVACNSFNYHTHEFIAGTACGQGPYDVHIPADGTTAEDGIEVIACTPRRIAGHVELVMEGFHDNTTFGSAADNQRCVGGGGVVTATASGSSSTSSSIAGSGSATGTTPALIEQRYSGTESAFNDDLCKAFGLMEQDIIGPETSRNDIGDAPRKGMDMHIRIWSDVPNDLSGVIFMVRQLTSTHAPEKPEPVEHVDWHDDKVASTSTPSPPQHGAPPPPLVEATPARTSEAAAWVPGYWTWTGSQWGWNAGFWRDGDVPAPRVEMPGTAPTGAIWVGGNWQRHSGSWVWIAGRWRTR